MSSDRATTALDRLIGSFMDRQRRGERPTTEEYARAHPELADQIRDVFPALEILEEFGGAKTDHQVPPTAREETPTRLGEFRILREVGRGGMGIVYEAMQSSLERHVALKVLPAQARADETYLQRFRREAQSAARLHHTSIVPVFSVGEEDGVCYYAMQYIAGQTLAAVLQEIGRVRGPETTVNLLQGSVAHSLMSQEFALPGAAAETKVDAAPDLQGSEGDLKPYFRNVARIGAQVADALAYAHGQGVIHRDVKPANLMLDLEGGVWVTDFGLAKLEGGDELTHTGDILGTLRYSAPEQLCGKAEARSDVYSLGITLYEMATLKPAFDDPVKARLVDRVLKEEPTAPGKLEPRLPKDLETIILKATAKEPGRRYPSANELAEDLRRFLADRPVKARRTSRFEHMWRWCRRNPAVSLTVSAFVFSLTAGSVATAALAFQARRERLAAVEAREVSDRNLRRALRAIDAMLSRVGGQDLQGVPRMDGVQRELLEQALALYQDLLQDYEDDPEVRYQTSLAHLRVAGLYAWVGRNDRSVRHNEKALALADGLVETHGREVRYRVHLAKCLRDLGWRLGDVNPQGALSVLRQNESAWQGLARDHPDTLLYRVELANSHRLRGNILLQAGDRAEAESAFRAGLEAYRALTEAEAALRYVRHGIATMHAGLANALAAAGNHPDACASYRAAADLLEAVRREDPKNSDYPWLLAHVYHDHGRLLDKMGEAVRAEQAYRRALRLREEMVSSFPTKSILRDDLVESYRGLEALLRRTGQAEEAAGFRAQAVARLRQLIADFPDRADYRRQLKGFLGESGAERPD